eukprot:scaffold89542_cov33-Tisochrysis_lutea.AAC.2
MDHRLMSPFPTTIAQPQLVAFCSSSSAGIPCAGPCIVTNPIAQCDVLCVPLKALFEKFVGEATGPKPPVSCRHMHTGHTHLFRSSNIWNQCRVGASAKPKPPSMINSDEPGIGYLCCEVSEYSRVLTMGTTPPDERSLTCQVIVEE